MSHRRPGALTGRAGLALAFALAHALACESSTGLELPADGPPDALAVRADGFGFGTHAVTLRGDTLVVERREDWRPDGAEVTRTVPTRAQWASFWRAADDAGVRTWPRRCANTNVVDGGGFSLEITYAGETLAASGTNSYPRRGGRCSGGDVTRDYLALMTAVSALVGRQFP